MRRRCTGPPSPGCACARRIAHCSLALMPRDYRMALYALGHAASQFGVRRRWNWRTRKLPILPGRCFLKGSPFGGAGKIAAGPLCARAGRPTFHANLARRLRKNLGSVAPVPLRDISRRWAARRPRCCWVLCLPLAGLPSCRQLKAAQTFRAADELGILTARNEAKIGNAHHGRAVIYAVVTISVLLWARGPIFMSRCACSCSRVWGANWFCG